MRERSEAVLKELAGAPLAGAMVSEAKGDHFPLAAGRLGVALHTLLAEFARNLEGEIALMTQAETAPGRPEALRAPEPDVH